MLLGFVLEQGNIAAQVLRDPQARKRVAVPVVATAFNSFPSGLCRSRRTDIWLGALGPLAPALGVEKLASACFGCPKRLLINMTNAGPVIETRASTS